MQLVGRLKFVTVLATIGDCFPAGSHASELEVKTDSGVLYGLVNSSAPGVRQFLGIPFAHPPVGPRRWLPPLRLESNASINASNIGRACPQISITQNDADDVYSPRGGNHTEFFPLEMFSEDCLTLNVWAPRTLKRGLPVFVWNYGGRFSRGGTSSLYYNPQSWVQRTQEHIVVTVNFRSNIFGFPNADGITEQNLGLMDQRMALEWVRDNIANFGGDASRIVTWGQSSGAIAMDYLNFAYPSDPIASGMILDSGSALYPQAAAQSSDAARTNFTAVALALGCGCAASRIDCLRAVSWQEFEAVIKGNSTLTFLPVADDTLVFSNYTARYKMGALSSIPALMGTNQHEFNYNPRGAYFNQTISDKETDIVFGCTTAKTSQLRQSSSRITYRYRYDGNFTNISPPDYPGAFHAAELPLIFGTAGDYHGASTTYENTVSSTIQNLWLDFAKCPSQGLKDNGWNPYGEGKAVLISADGIPVQEIDVSELDMQFDGKC